MRAVVSPYHLTTREPPAMVALLLASGVTTLLPAPSGGRDAAQAEAALSPAYMTFMRSWRWSEALWRAGVIAGGQDDEGPGPDVAEAWRMIQEDPACAGARALLRRDLYDDESEYLRALAIDVLRAGPDPGVSAPVALGLDRYAARRGMMVMRPDPASIVQKTEAGLAGGPSLSVAVPVLLEADGETILRAREALSAELNRVREAIGRAVDRLEAGAPDAAARTDLRAAAGAYQRAFDAALPDLAASVPDDEPRLVAGLVSLTLSSFPADVALRATAAATRRLGGGAGAGSATEGEAQIALRDPLAGARFGSIVVRVISRG